jgi:GT2 family glycosyltransferase
VERVILKEPATALAPQLPACSLVICTRNRRQMLRETVASILGADEVPDEILIVDQSDASEPFEAPASSARRCELRYLWLDAIGSSRARNAGAAAAKHEVLIFIDDDMFVDHGWYTPLIQTLVRAGPHTAVTGRVEAAPSEKPDSFVVAVHAWDGAQVHVGRINKDVLATGFMALYRVAYEESGGLDERLGPGTPFPGAEDNDYGFRLLEDGYQVIYVPDSVVYHRAWRSNREYVPLFWKYGLGQGAFYAKHLSVRDPYMLSRWWCDMRRYLRLLPKRLWKRQLLVTAGGTAFVLGECVGAIGWKLTQGKVRR